jgi:hypothetical protein
MLRGRKFTNSAKGAYGGPDGGVLQDALPNSPDAPENRVPRPTQSLRAYPNMRIERISYCLRFTQDGI